MGFNTHFHEGRMRTQERRTTFQSDFDLGGGITNECNPTNFVDVDHQSGMGRRLATILGQASRLNVYVALGIHPKQADARISEDDWYAFRSLLRSRNFVAVGEFGLDSSRGSLAPIGKQIEVASRCIDLATELDLPMIIHQRDSEDAMLRLFRSKRVDPDTELHLHCFTGTLQQAEGWMTYFPNARFGVTNLVTFPSATRGPQASSDSSDGENTPRNRRPLLPPAGCNRSAFDSTPPATCSRTSRGPSRADSVRSPAPQQEECRSHLRDLSRWAHLNRPVGTHLTHQEHPDHCLPTQQLQTTTSEHHTSPTANITYSYPQCHIIDTFPPSL